MVEGLFVLDDLLADGNVGFRGAGVGGDFILVVLDDGVVGNDGPLVVLRSRAAEQKRAHDKHVPLDAGILLDDSRVEERNEEDSSQESDGSAGAHGDTSDKRARLLVEAEVGRAFVDDGESANGACNQEPEWCGPDSPRNGVLAHVNNHFDKHENCCSKAGGDSRSHSKTSKDSTETLSVVPSPLDFVCSSDGDTDTSNSGDERVGGRDVGRVLSAPHDPGRGGCKSAGESQHLNADIAIEGVDGNDAVLDCVGGTSTNGDSSEEFEDGAENHGLPVGDRPGRDTGSPGVGYIVGAVVVCIEHGKARADGEDVGVRHVVDDLWSVLIGEGVMMVIWVVR